MKRFVEGGSPDLESEPESEAERFIIEPDKVIGGGLRIPGRRIRVREEVEVEQETEKDGSGRDEATQHRDDSEWA